MLKEKESGVEVLQSKSVSGEEASKGTRKTKKEVKKHEKKPPKALKTVYKRRSKKLIKKKMKLKKEFFLGRQIRNAVFDENFERELNSTELAA